MQDRPDNVVIYDGACVFCHRQVERLRRLDRLGRLSFIPMQAPDLEQRFPQIAGGDFNTGMRFIDAADRVYVGADAVHQIVRRLPLVRFATWLYRVPGLHWAANQAYGWIAANRFRMADPCEDEVCASDPSSATK